MNPLASYMGDVGCACGRRDFGAGATVPSPNAIGAQLVEMDGQADAIDAAMSGPCGLNPPVLFSQWKSFLFSYRAFSAKSRSTLGSTLALVSAPYAYAAQLSDISQSADSYQAQLNAWAAISDAQCGGHAGQTQEHAGPSVGISSAVTPITLLVLAVGGVWALINYGPRRKTP